LYNKSKVFFELELAHLNNAGVIDSKIEEITINSSNLNEELKVMVYLPPNYSPLYTYPVLYVQDGQDYFQLGRIARIADEGIENNELEDIIIVGIPYHSVEDRWNKYNPKGDKFEGYQKFLVHELVPLIDQKYSTHHLAFGRALIGDSLAGTISLATCLNYPHTFANIAMQSPYVSNEILQLCKAYKNQFSSLTIYHVIGKQETKVKVTNGKEKDFLTPNRQLNEILNEKPFTYFYDEFSGDHTWTYWQPDLKRALRKLFPKN
jgi:enterochelin esterase-like enzyme